MDWKKIAPKKRHGLAAAELLESYGINTALSGEELLMEVAQVFTHLPYENLTKLLRKQLAPPDSSRFRLPTEVVGDHLEKGAGGTCFSLSCLFGIALEKLGVASYPVVARMRSQRALHCGLVVPCGGEKYLLDPGYLIHRPLRISGESVSQKGDQGGKVVVASTKQEDIYHLHSGGRWRYTFRDDPMSASEFMKLWLESFDWPMMNNIHLSRVVEGGYLYARGHHVRRNVGGETSNENIRANQVEALSEYFQISRNLAEEALKLIMLSRQSGDYNKKKMKRRQ